MAAIQIGVTSGSSQLRAARHTLRDRLDADLALERDHTDALASVANELLGAALDARVRKPLILSVELFPRLSSVRVRCPSDVELRDEPFGMRERVLRGFAFAWGKRSYTDGSVDLWAEVARPAARQTAGP
jgi:hypothetical protein